jgi:hypothetical protein
VVALLRSLQHVSNLDKLVRQAMKACIFPNPSDHMNIPTWSS